MERFVSFTELKQNLRAVKESAREDLVHVLSNGRPGYVLCSFEVWERRMAAAARRGTYRANVEESMREGVRDFWEGRLVPAADVAVLDVDVAGLARVSESALRYLDLEYDGEQRDLLGQTLSELVRRPGMGQTVDVEYDGTDLSSVPIRRFFSPPCDVLYTTDNEGGLVVFGFVRSLEW